MKAQRDIDRVKLIAFPVHGGENGSLTMYQQGEDGLPFDPQKVLIVKGMQKDDVRGRHAHYENDEIVAAVQGGCDAESTDGEETVSHRIDAGGPALFLPARVWRTLKNFEPDTIILIITSQKYDESDYIRTYEKFLEMRKSDSPS
jgi:hypothetical protein